jgi:hypothetical protein
MAASREKAIEVIGIVTIMITKKKMIATMKVGVRLMITMKMIMRKREASGVSTRMMMTKGMTDAVGMRTTKIMNMRDKEIPVVDTRAAQVADMVHTKVATQEDTVTRVMVHMAAKAVPGGRTRKEGIPVPVGAEAIAKDQAEVIIHKVGLRARVVETITLMATVATQAMEVILPTAAEIIKVPAEA